MAHQWSKDQDQNIISILVLLMCTIYTTATNAQYFQQGVSYDITASLDSSHVITAKTDITYTNHSPNVIDTIYLHLWANAFSDRLSAYSDQSIRMGSLDFYFAPDSHLGGYRNLKVSAGGRTADIYSWNDHKDVTYILLPKPLTPGQSIEINTSYELRLPKNFSRIGWNRTEDYLTYWHPSPAVYDAKGWHPMPYLNMGECYTEVADYKVSLTTQQPHLIATDARYQRSGDTYTLTASRVPDFAIITSKKKTVASHQLTSIDGRDIDVKIMTASSTRDSSLITYLQDALPYFESKIGPFPYPSLSILDKGEAATSGMEYPGLITVSSHDKANSNLHYYLVHELLHQYFYGALSFDQRRYAWLDEGLTTYYQQRYFEEVVGYDHYSQMGKILMRDGQQPLLQSFARGQACRHYHAPISLPVEHMDPLNYGLNAYEIPARMYAYLSDYIGMHAMDQSIQKLYDEWYGKHPSPEDVQAIMEGISGKDLSWFFEQLIQDDWAYDYAVTDLTKDGLSVQHRSGSTPPYHVTLRSSSGDTTSIWIPGHEGHLVHPLPAGDWDTAIIDEDGHSMDINRDNNSHGMRRPLRIVPFVKVDDSRYREIYISHLLSYNTSDGGQLGLAMYNSSFPTKKLKWAIAPSYGFASKKLVGEGWISYDQYLSHPGLRKLQYKLNAKTFSFRNSNTIDKSLRYVRISPHVSLHLHHDAIDHKYSKIYFKPIFLNEEFFDFTGEDVVIKNTNNMIYRLGYEYYDFWALGPMDINVQFEYQPYENAVGERHQYSKITAALNKAYKFGSGRSFDLRLWASYFLTNSQRQAANYDGTLVRGSSALIYQGFNDYAYDDYFFNRQNQNVRLSNQISYAGGGFKTPIGSQYSLGQTNDLALALNLKSDLPIKTPRLLPLKLFMDIGYVRTKSATEQTIKGQSLVSGGVMLEYGEGLFSIYLPLFNSQAISEIYDAEGTSLLGRVSFRIDLIRFNPWDIAEDYSF